MSTLLVKRAKSLKLKEKLPDYKILFPQGLLLSKKEDQKCSRDSVILRHPPFCPMLHLSQELKEKVKNQSHIGVSVAVAVILG